MHINEIMGWSDEHSRMDRAIEHTLKYLQAKGVDDSGEVKNTLLMAAKKMGVNRIKKLFDYFHDKIAKREIPVEYSFYSNASLGKNDPRMMEVRERRET